MKRFLPLAVMVLGVLLALAPSAPAADPAKPPGEGDFSSVNSITALLPHEIQVGLVSNATKDSAAATASETLHQGTQGKTATLKLKVDTIGKDMRDDTTKDAYKIRAADEYSHLGGVNFHVILWVHFDVSENAKFATLRKGGEITASGRITRSEVSVVPRGLNLNIDLSGAVLK